MTRTIVITGASSGIGAVAAEQLKAGGDEVAVVGRNPERTRGVAERIGATPFLADFERLDDVRALAAALLDRYETIDVLANNAGGLYHERELTVDGHERTIQANHLAPFLLTALLRPRLIETAASGRDVRVVSTASLANRFGNLRVDDLDWERRPWQGGWRAYGTAKLATILFAAELAERLTGTGVGAYSFHPGTIATNFGNSSPLIRFGHLVTRSSFGISVAAGAAPLLFLAGPARVGAPTGTYFDRLTANGRVNPQARNGQLGRDLWAASEALVGLDVPA
ncbi:SDR family NAD(P)-dependent oxidoreductase [Leifsonia sp. 1010]|uniref:SDR family NAD(P)-dependent oxidoreductase n=1 Tax=Leifsonia sp. 1010 TaxID=2817769 RepID=UPI00285EDEBA|nr:SDR family NAD(P)-dependent oxidoreductase [Leifsonia sp. 1010]MDR6612646.1 NAD(P)-dependent dehydrogenase (short-subunit alcohol dehydrogenase family) [Leifsonia sp. 1010]